MQNSIQTKDRASLIGENEAGEFLGISPRTLQQWRQRGCGPKYVSISRRCVKYRLTDLDLWAESRLAASTSDAGKVSAK